VEHHSRLFFACSALAMMCVPLIFKWIPQNSFYGIRTHATLANQDTWFAINQFGGICIFVASCVSMAILYFTPWEISAKPLFSVLSIIGPLLLAAIAIFLHLRSLSS